MTEASSLVEPRREAEVLRRAVLHVFVASAVFLFTELALVRWTGSELHLLAFVKNLIVIAAFLGGGLGMVAGVARPGLANLTWLVPAGAVAIPLLSGMESLRNLQFGDPGEFRWDVLRAANVAEMFAGVLFFTCLFTFSVLLFAGLGVLIARPLTALPALRGYTWNLAGSLAGVVLFAVVALLELSPPLWMALLAPALGWAYGQNGRGLAMGAVVLASSGLAGYLSEPAWWSPYNRIAVHSWGPTAGAPFGYDLTVNRSYFMTMLDLGRSVEGSSRLDDARRHYDMPYRFTAPRDVLVLGAGAGNDVAAALRSGARHVDAVEIDPRIVALGRQLHPEQPYTSPDVRVIVDDARNWLRRTESTYDLIVFGLLDSHTLLAGLPGVRLDNYVYTTEALRDARSRLGPDGVLVLSFAVVDSYRWVASKLYGLVTQALGESAVVIDDGYDVAVTFVGGPGLHTERGRAAVEALGGRRLPTAPFAADLTNGISLPTDDWPHLYLRQHGMPTIQLVLLCLLGLVAIVLMATVSRVAVRPDLFFALFGAGFLLVETKGIADLGLLFGGTWWTVTALFAAVLCLALVSVVVVRIVQPQRSWPYYVGLFLTLLLAYVVRPGMLLGLPLPLAQVAGSLLFAAPVFFSGVLFARAFAATKDSAGALGSNLLGAVLGGFLEYASLAYGVRFLSLIAVALYGLAAVVRQRGIATR